MNKVGLLFFDLPVLQSTWNSSRFSFKFFIFSSRNVIFEICIWEKLWKFQCFLRKENSLSLPFGGHEGTTIIRCLNAVFFWTIPYIFNQPFVCLSLYRIDMKITTVIGSRLKFWVIIFKAIYSSKETINRKLEIDET